MSKTLVQLIQEKTGISEEQAQGALNTVIGFLKEKLPEPLAAQLDGVVNSDVSAASEMMNTVTSTLGGLFGKKE
ncbi:DUF2267 domain-containing protein [Candidatus Oscillochloris fontis]|uniref:DUF2267 domain-containing protein n=1 Tax=Candidatus Oscillochloris fontis TaxID=2496868 RepID=UPI00101C48EA|nr:DUF2267 domain-containing protein [Candidatus Oscillochloris fontis]